MFSSVGLEPTTHRPTVGRGAWVVGRGSWVVGRGSWVVGRGALHPDTRPKCPSPTDGPPCWTVPYRRESSPCNNAELGATHNFSSHAGLTHFFPGRRLVL